MSYCKDTIYLNAFLKILTIKSFPCTYWRLSAHPGLTAIATSFILASTNAYAHFSNTLYGNFRFSAALINRNSTGSDGLTTNNSASRIGIKGSVGNSDLKAIYNLQTGAKNDASGSGFTSRFFFAGLKGYFGSVIFGRHSTPNKMSSLRVDPFYDTSAGLGNGGDTYGLSSMTNGFTNNTLSYISPV